MKKYDFSIRLLMGLLVVASGVGLNGQLVSAQDVAGSAKTEFQPNDNLVPPIDPKEDEDEDIIPIHPPTKGPLSINYASNITFGQHKKKRSDETFYAKEDIVTLITTKEEKSYPNFVQVTDLRGSASGWLLSVRQNGPFKNEKGEALTGAKMKVSAESIISHSGMTQVPTDLTKNQVLSDDGSTFHPIVKAKEQTGIGTWSVFLGVRGQKTAGISLSVPKNVPKNVGIYSTTLTWSLQDAL